MIWPQADTVVSDAEHQLIQLGLFGMPNAQMILVQVHQHRDQGGTLVPVVEWVIAANTKCQSGCITKRLWILPGLRLPCVLAVYRRFKQTVLADSH
jgi:hypothetical protein